MNALAIFALTARPGMTRSPETSLEFAMHKALAICRKAFLDADQAWHATIVDRVPRKRKLRSALPRRQAKCFRQDYRQPVTPRMASADHMSSAAISLDEVQTLPALFRWRVEKTPHQEAYRQFDDGTEGWI